MIARVDGVVVSPESLWWPNLNFNQFRWPGRVGHYELELPRADFNARLGPEYRLCVAELQADDRLVPGQDSPLNRAGYPPLEDLPDHPDGFVEVVSVYMPEALLGEFLPFCPSAARFMVNSIEDVLATPSVVIVRGRGYHGAPGFAGEG